MDVRGVAAVCLALVGVACADEPALRLSLDGLMALTDARSARASSYDRSGGNHDWIGIAPGETACLADIDGAGCVRHFYWAYIIADEPIRNAMLRDVILRMYWDGEESPSVEAPIGDFFGMGNCQVRRLNSLLLVANPGSGTQPSTWGMNSYFPMPFARGARIELWNDGQHQVGVWYHIDYETYPRRPKGLSDLGRFHAQFRRSNPTTAIRGVRGTNLTGSDNYTILEATGRGNVAGYVLNVDNVTGDWWGEGDDMVFIDGETWPPSFHGTGSEEIFGGGACPDVEYSGPYTGFHTVENRQSDSWYGKNSMYRLFVHDPIHFAKSVRVTIEHGHANNLANDYSSVAFWYQKEPHRPFPTLPTRAERQPTSVYPRDLGVGGVYELESAIGRAKTSGEALIPMGLSGGWSRGRLAVLMSNEPGDFLMFRAPVEADGTYRVIIRYAKADDLAIARLLIDGSPVGEPFDAYNGEGGQGRTHVVGPAEADLGAATLLRGEHEFRLEATGKNPASAGYVIAVDCIRLRRDG